MFIKLTYYEHNKTFPEQSGSTGKQFLFRVEDISEVVPYENSTKIIKRYTDKSIEVVESMAEIEEKIKGAD